MMYEKSTEDISEKEILECLKADDIDVAISKLISLGIHLEILEGRAEGTATAKIGL